ncbi:hypothetical protein ZWY2020_034209 [Hordeum vulgare]|nr:hypothetical protein ZWY2020_034209 [Hordeum vulgare]
MLIIHTDTVKVSAGKVKGQRLPPLLEAAETGAYAGASRQELANHQQPHAAAPAPHDTDAELAGGGETEEQRGKFLVLRLYEALNARDARRAQDLLAPDLEWWFHGPPAHQHMMRLLTGAGTNDEFRFCPRSVDAFGSTVVAEGSADGAGQLLYWVHAWTVGPDGVITQLREYFNTDLTVTRLSAAAATKNASASSPTHSSSSSTSSSPSSSTSSGLSSPAHTPKWPKCLWQSRRTDRARKSLPGLVLAI